ncbi:MAG TPA: bacillithiol biosynthesis cysteine-adding enzyme BshC [Acidobacteriota bacterium]|jgi:bacillithiol biosynthesis cysteine-adding enzyme BshC
MKASLIDYARLPEQSRLFLEFLRFEGVQQFYNSYHRGCAALKELADHRLTADFPRREIAHALQNFNRRVENDLTALSNAARIVKPQTLVVVTGQQAGLFGGPALTFYKAITAILIANKLNAEGFSAVPLFWVASEDHDFEEIRGTSFLDPRGRQLDLQINSESALPLTAAQRHTGDTAPMIQQCAEFLSQTDHSAVVIDWLRNSYRSDTTIAEAFTRLLAKVFGPAGLVFIDASDPAVRKLAQNHFRTAVEEAEKINEVLKQRVKQLKESGFEPQAHWEEDYTLLFHVTERGRRAIRRSNGNFVSEEQKWSTRDLLGEISQSPERFSPSALLRPIIQDAILPSVLYIGGAAEIAYFAQVHALAKIFGWAPVIQPRLAVTLLDSRAARYLERNDLQAPDAFCTLEELQEKMARSRLGEGVLDHWKQHVSNAARELDSLTDLASRIDATLGKAWQLSRRKIDYQIQKTERKLLRASAQKSERIQEQAAFLHSMLYPCGTLQERRINFLSFYARYGPRLMNNLGSLSPCEKSHYVVTLE